ncbi:hypothetical protein LWM68_40865 [Niabella sp. W65]|nr:hypothetical protein [Niabella sp. W65]MCH7368525.1 hypothetical protein [Niabella sp. W65]
MRRSIQVVPIGNGYGFGSLGVPYASIHNQGGQISQAARSETFVRNRYKRGAKGKMFGGMGHLKRYYQGRGQSYKARVINMPKRQFIGASPALRRELIWQAQEYIRARIK